MLGKTLAKDLTDWAISCCIAELTEKLPVVTLDDLKSAAKAYTKKRDSGANTGSEAHAMVESFLKDTDQHYGDHSPEARAAFGAFVKWFDEKKPEILNVEEVIYSQEFGYAGTYDGLMKIDGKVCLTDFKTTNASRKAPNGVYAEMFLQLGAYAAAHDEQRLYEEANGGTTLLPIEELTVISCQKNGTLNVISASDVGYTVEDCKQMFRKVYNLYRFLAHGTKELGGK